MAWHGMVVHSPGLAYQRQASESSTPRMFLGRHAGIALACHVVPSLGHDEGARNNSSASSCPFYHRILICKTRHRVEVNARPVWSRHEYQLLPAVLSTVRGRTSSKQLLQGTHQSLQALSRYLVGGRQKSKTISHTVSPNIWATPALCHRTRCCIFVIKACDGAKEEQQNWYDQQGA